MTQVEIDAADKLMKVFREFKRDMRKPSHTRGMKSGEMAVMRTVAHHQMDTGEGIRVSEIGKILKIANPTVTQFINGLEKTGWVTRKMDEQDRRSVLVYLTEEGKKRHQLFEDTMTEMFQSLTQHIGLEDTMHLIRIIPKAFLYMEMYMQKCQHDESDSRSWREDMDKNEKISKVIPEAKVHSKIDQNAKIENSKTINKANQMKNTKKTNSSKSKKEKKKA